MAIRFFCKGCNQLLGIASRKAGTDIACPTCGLMQTVPTEEAAAAAMAMVRSGPLVGKADVPVLPELQVYDDNPAAIDFPPPAAEPVAASTDVTGASASPAPPPVAAPRRDSGGPPLPSPAPPGTPGVGEPAPPGTILFPRRVIYLQAVVFLVAGAALFAAGYFIGRGDATIAGQLAAEAAARVEVLVEGTLAYNPRPGEAHGDEGAVVIALPADARPDPGLSADGLRPRDPLPDEDRGPLRRLRELGGGYARADAAGHFAMILPDAGEYHFLVISANAVRERGEEVDEIDQQEMRRYFEAATAIIGRAKYRWEMREFEGGAATFDHSFGASG